jgi:hypothetical protein
MGSDNPGTVGGAGGSGVHNQVVDDAFMYLQCLQTSHPANPVRPVALPCSADLRVATDPYPHHRKARQGYRQPLLRRTAPQEDFIQDETRPAAAYRCQACVPGRLSPAEVLSHVTDPSGPNSMEPGAPTGPLPSGRARIRSSTSSPPGSARTRSSSPSVIHVGPSSRCRQWAMEVLPELEPPFKTTTGATHLTVPGRASDTHNRPGQPEPASHQPYGTPGLRQKP